MTRARSSLPAMLGCVTLGIALLAGCASPDDEASRRAGTALEVPAVTAPPSSTPDTTRCPQSLRPAPGPPPAPMQMPAGSWMAEIQRRGRLQVGVDQNTLFFGRRTRSGELEGLEIDLAAVIARAIFGNDLTGRIEYKVVSTPDRIPAVKGTEDGDPPTVDMVVSLMTMTCSRSKNDVSFSSQYFDASQGVLVPKDSEINEVADVAGKRVCATRSSTSSSRMRERFPTARVLEVDNRTECLVAMLDGRVDAITADDTILYGFLRQVPKATILPQRLGPEPYGIAMNQGHPDFVRFVNGVLEQRRADGTLDAIAKRWSEAAGVVFPPIPEPEYVD